MSEQSEDETRALREAFGAFMTGVTVVTAAEKGGPPVGFTANSFTSVSLDPPLLLVCLSRHSRSLPTIEAADGFAVNILAKDQKSLSDRFAGPPDNRFEGVEWRRGPVGAPVLSGVCGWFDCHLHDRVEAGDHVILIGRVGAFDHDHGHSLGFARGDYFSLDH